MTQQPDRDEDGYYHVGGDRLPSVTTVIGDQLDQPGLEAWKERTDDWRAVRDRAALRGTLVHRRVLSQYAVRDLPIEEVPVGVLDGEMLTDLEVAEALWADVNGEIPIDDTPHVEETLWSTDAGGFAGTADLLTGGVVVDLKTSSAVRESHRLQASAYAKAARQRGVMDVDRAAIVKLDPDGPSAGVTWLDAEELDALYDRFRELVEGFHAQQRLG